MVHYQNLAHTFSPVYVSIKFVSISQAEEDGNIAVKINLFRKNKLVYAIKPQSLI